MQRFHLPLLISLCSLTTLQAATRYVDADATGTDNGTSWTNAYPDLQSALAVATSGDEIWVAAGTYYPDEGANQTNNARGSTFALKPGAALYGGFTGSETLLSQRDPNPETNGTILSGDIDQNDGANFINNSGNSYHVLTASGSAMAIIGSATVLNGFTITAGNANGTEPENRGGGMYLDNASPAITNALFKGNMACHGGGIFNSFSSPIITKSSFRGNGANISIFEGGSGGGIYNYFSSPIIINTSFQGNAAGISSSYGGSGGGILNHTSSPTITNVSFQGNRALHAGGGISNHSSSPTITNTSFQGNSAISYGGGIYNHTSSLIITNCILWSNFETGNPYAPGASVANQNSNATYSHCLIANSRGSTNWNRALGTDNGNNIDTNPLFVSATNLQLQAGSPAINVGNNAVNSTTTDLAGNLRLAPLAPIDLGAYEFQVQKIIILNPPNLYLPSP